LSNDTDADDDPLTITAFTTPSLGTVTQDVSGALTYAAPTTLTGITARNTSFAYTIG